MQIKMVLYRIIHGNDGFNLELHKSFSVTDFAAYPRPGLVHVLPLEHTPTMTVGVQD